MFELNEWFRSQTIYTPEEVAKFRSDFKDQVDKMSAKELQDVISDMEAKFRILDTPEVQEVRAWFGRYISLLADWRREEVLRDIPNFAKMTASQLNQEIMKIQRARNLPEPASTATARHRSTPNYRPTVLRRPLLGTGQRSARPIALPIVRRRENVRTKTCT